MKTKLILLLAVLFVYSGWQEAIAQGTAFTYQGQLMANGGPASGSFDLQFSIFDSSTPTNQIGNSLTNLATSVNSGLFTVTLDFGAGVFTGPQRWLEVGVRSNGTGNFTTLSPLQLLTAAPYAISAGNLTSTLPASQLPASVVTNNQSNLTLSGTFSGNGSGLTNTPGTVSWQTPSGTNLQAQSNVGYVLTNNSIVTLTLPASPNVGDVVQVVGQGAGGWILAQNAGQAISGNFTPLWDQVGVPPSENWTGVASSSDGMHLVVVAAGGDVYTSIDSGTTWEHQINAPIRNWYAIASSSDGTKLAVVVYGGGIYTSVNSGTNWVLQTGAPGATWVSIVSSSDGTKLAAAAQNYGIFTSVNSGTNWTQQINVPSAYWNAIASSSDGTKLVAVSQTNGIYVSLNSGASWVQQNNLPSGAWTSVAMSSDGTFMVAGEYADILYTTVSSGAIWTHQTNAPNITWTSMAASSDGTRLVAGTQGYGVWTSSNAGTNWTSRIGNVGVVASSSDGTKLAAVGSTGYFYTSINSGTNWILQTGSMLPQSATSTTSGTTGFLEGTAATGVELIYTGGGNFMAVSQVGTIYSH